MNTEQMDTNRNDAEGHRRSRLAFLLGLLCSVMMWLAACVATPQEARLSPYTGPKARTAIVGFNVYARTYGVGDLDKRLVEMLSGALFRTGRYDLVERKEIERVLREQRFQLSDVVDPATAVRIGKILGAQTIVTGAITEIGFSAASFIINATICTVGIDVRVIDVETARIVMAETGHGRTFMGGFIFNKDALKAVARRQLEAWISEAMRGAAEDVARKVAASTAVGL